MVVGAALLLGCTGPEPPLPAPATQSAALVARQTLREVHLGRGTAPVRPQVVLSASWGSGAGQLGKRDEASRPGPMSLAVADDGEIYVLDQVNRRVLRHDATGRLRVQIPIPSEATEDIVVVGQSLYALVYESGAHPGYRVERHAIDGSGCITALTLPRSIQLVTGLFWTGPPAVPDLWVEQRHDIHTRVLHGDQALDLHTVLGRPDRRVVRSGPHSGERRLTVLRTGTRRARVLQVEPPPEETTRPLLDVATDEPLVAIQELESDAYGRIYLGLLLGEDGPDGLVRARKVMLVCCRDGTYRAVELFVQRATDVFRPVVVDRQGRIYQLQTTEQGVTLWRWAASEGGVP